MTRVSRILQVIGQRNDVMLAVLLMAIIFMMILPLPTALLDFLIATNMMVSILLLMVALYVPTPSLSPPFPTLLLITTLFRLALNDLDDAADPAAGRCRRRHPGVRRVRGRAATSSSALVVFLIITIVQFIVIAKGAERVAEVARALHARRDARQADGIDADLRAGTIDMRRGAQRRRALLERESQLYGAMDGAMKFVKGDAIAGLIIIAGQHRRRPRDRRRAARHDRRRRRCSSTRC